MKSLAIFSTLLVACSTAVSAWSCLSDADAQNIIKEQIVFLQHSDLAAGRAAGEALFAPDFKEYGDSINALRMDALGTVVEPNAAVYINDTLSIPGPTQINTLAVVHDCSRIVFFWQFLGIGGPSGQRIQGMSLITVDSNSKVIQHNVEFNSLTWAENLGANVTWPAGGGPAKVKREWIA